MHSDHEAVGRSYWITRAAFALLMASLLIVVFEMTVVLAMYLTGSRALFRLMSDPNWSWFVGTPITFGSVIGMYMLWGRWSNPGWKRRAGILAVLGVADVALWVLDHHEALGLGHGEVGHDWLRSQFGQLSGWIEFWLIASLAVLILRHARASHHAPTTWSFHGEPEPTGLFLEYRTASSLTVPDLDDAVVLVLPTPSPTGKTPAQPETTINDPNPTSSPLPVWGLLTMGLLVWFLAFVYRTNWGKGWPLMPHRLGFGPWWLIGVVSYSLWASASWSVARACLDACKRCSRELAKLEPVGHADQWELLKSRSETEDDFRR